MLKTYTEDHITTGIDVISRLDTVLQNRPIKTNKGLPHMELGEADDTMPKDSGISDSDY
ncbi:AMP nucleosidase domain protein [Chlamydia psittaci 84-8471/1]|nr:AMP nucleosidase domain protein [Chlamydia psittaci 84-8471/1]